jgi:hypothetical protein
VPLLRYPAQRDGHHPLPLGKRRARRTCTKMREHRFVPRGLEAHSTGGIDHI